MSSSPGLAPSGDAAGAAATPEPPYRSQLELRGAGRNFIWSTLPSVFTLLSSVFTLAYTVRRVGSREYGAIVVIYALLSLFTVLTFSLTFASARLGAKLSRSEDGEARREMQSAHSVFVVCSVALSLAGVAFGWVVPLDVRATGHLGTQAYIGTILFTVSGGITLAVTAYQGVLTGAERFRAIAWLSLIGSASRVALIVALVGQMKIVGVGIALVGSTLVQSTATLLASRSNARWLRLLPALARISAFRSVFGYSAGIIVLMAIGAIISASDAFVIGGLIGPVAVTTYRLGSVGPTQTVNLFYTGFGVLFPKMVKTDSLVEQEEGMAYLGRVIGWLGGVTFAAMSLLGADIVRILLGHSSNEAVVILCLFSGGVALDVPFHGLMQVVFARNQQHLFARWGWIQLVLNLALTVILVVLLGAVGAAMAAVFTFALSDLLLFPLVIGRRWNRPMFPYILRNGVGPTLAAALLTIAIGFAPLHATGGIGIHIGIVSLAVLAVCAIGYLRMDKDSRTRTWSLLRRPPDLAPH